MNKLAVLNKKVDEQNWLKSRLSQLFDETKGLDNIQVISEKIITTLSTQLGAGIGAFYLNDALFTNSDKDFLKLTASYAFNDRKSSQTKFELGEGLVGQAALEKKPYVLLVYQKIILLSPRGLAPLPQNKLLFAQFCTMIQWLP